MSGGYGGLGNGGGVGGRIGGDPTDNEGWAGSDDDTRGSAPPVASIGGVATAIRADVEVGPPETRAMSSLMAVFSLLAMRQHSYACDESELPTVPGFASEIPPAPSAFSLGSGMTYETNKHHAIGSAARLVRAATVTRETFRRTDGPSSFHLTLRGHTSMVWFVQEVGFRDLRKLADWFAAGPQSPALPIDRIVQRLGAMAIPLLGRELRHEVPWRRAAARDALATLAAQGPALRARVTAALHPITNGAATDEAKVVALGLLSELGEHADVRFADPRAIQVRSAIALASHLETAADVAGAADLLVHQFAAGDLVRLLEVIADTAPNAAHQLATELGVRLDVPGDLRDRIALVVAGIAPRLVAEADGPHRPPVALVHAAVLVDAAARRVVIACRKIAGEPRFRRWAVQIGASGRIEDCLHEDDAGPDDSAAALTARLCAEGYRVASTELAHAHEVVAAAARLTAEATHALPSPYYLGRDLLDLADAHLEARGRADPAPATIARAIELVAAGDHGRAQPLLERGDPANPDAAAALAAVLLAQHRPHAALAALERALAAEPDWPLHHWNLAVALHQLGDASGCYHAFQRFVTTSAAPTGLIADPDQPARLRCAKRMISDLERTARLTGRSLGRRPRPRGARKKRSSVSS